MVVYERVGGSDEWYTPRYIFDALGLTFDLDVAAPAGGPLHVPAKRFFTSEDNGLSQTWDGLVWMNPPFGQQRQKRAWLSRFFDHGNGIALVPDRTSASWFQDFAPLADVICWVSPRIKFIRADGSVGSSPGTGTALFAVGERGTAAISQCGLGMLTGRWRVGAADAYRAAAHPNPKRA